MGLDGSRGSLLLALALILEPAVYSRATIPSYSGLESTEYPWPLLPRAVAHLAPSDIPRPKRVYTETKGLLDT